MDRFSSIQANQQIYIASLINSKKQLKDECRSPAYPMKNMMMNDKYYQQQLNDPSTFVKSNPEEIMNDFFSNTDKDYFGNAYTDTSVQNRSGRGFGGNGSYNNNIRSSHPSFYPANNGNTSNTIPNASHHFPGVGGNTTRRSLPNHSLSERRPVRGAGGRYNMARNPSYVNNSRSDRCLMSSSSNNTSFPMPVNDGMDRRAYSDGYVHPSLFNDNGIDMPAIPVKRRSSTINMTAAAATVAAGERMPRRRSSRRSSIRSPIRSPTTIGMAAAVTTVTAGEKTKMTKRRSSCRSMEAAAALVAAGERARSSTMCMANATVAAAGDRAIVKRRSSSRNMAAAALVVAAEDRASRRSPIISMANAAIVAAGERQMRRNSTRSMAAAAVTVAAGERPRRRSSTRSMADAAATVAEERGMRRSSTRNMAAAAATVAAEERGIRRSSTRSMAAAAATVAAEEIPMRRSSTRSMAVAAATVAAEEIPTRRSCTISMASAAATVAAEEREMRRSSTISMSAAAEEDAAMTGPTVLKVGRRRSQTRMMAFSAMSDGMAVAPPPTRLMPSVSISSVISLAPSTSSSSLCSMDNTVYNSLLETSTQFVNTISGNEEEDMKHTFEDDVDSFIAQTREKINIYDSSPANNQTGAGILHGGVANTIFRKEENTLIRKDSCCSATSTGTVAMNYDGTNDYETTLSKSTSSFRDMSCSFRPGLSDVSDTSVNGSCSDNDDEEDDLLENSSLSMPQNFLMKQVPPMLVTNKNKMMARRRARGSCTRRRNRIPSYNNDSDDSDRTKVTSNSVRSDSNSIRSDSSDKTEVTNNCRRNLPCNNLSSGLSCNNLLSPMKGKSRRRFRSLFRR